MVNLAQPPAIALPGETVVWTGAPPTGFRLRRTDVFAIPFSFLWGGFTIYSETMVLQVSAPWFFKLWGIPFVLAGLYIIFGRFLVDAALRERTSYSITDRSAYIARVGLFPSVRRYAGSALDTIQFEPRRDGSGTVRFNSANPLWRMFGGLGGWSLWNDMNLDVIQVVADAQRVYALVIDARGK